MEDKISNRVALYLSPRPSAPDHIQPLRFHPFDSQALHPEALAALPGRQPRKSATASRRLTGLFRFIPEDTLLASAYFLVMWGLVLQLSGLLESQDHRLASARDDDFMSKYMMDCHDPRSRTLNR